jgi:predicted metal-binding membrane protein
VSSTSAAGAPGTPPLLRRALSRDSLIVAIALALASALAWAWLMSAPMAGGGEGDMAEMAMPVRPWSAGYLLSAFAMWTIMMVAMMLPSAAPMILLHARIDRGSESQRRIQSLLFVSAYVLVWTVFAATAAAAQALLVWAGTISSMHLTVGEPAIVAALLIAAAAYELTTAKRLCLDKCRSPLQFVMRYWKPGAAGAFRLGTVHGLFCVGCCWALMLLLFAGGVMNLAWVAILGVIVIGEKLAPPAWHAHRWIASLLIVGAAAVLLGAG